MTGRGSETEGVGFFFQRTFGSIYVVMGKMTRITPHQPTDSRPSEARRGIWKLLKKLNLVGRTFAAGMRF